MQTAIFLLVIASLAALQSRAIRGAKRHQLQDICHQKGLPDVYDELVRASEGVAFFAATVVVLAAVAATFSISKLLTTSFSAGLWAGLCWIMLVIVPMTLTRFAGVWIVVTTWWLWRPLIRLITPVLRAITKGVEAIQWVLYRSKSRATADESQEEIRLAMDEAHREGHLDEEAREMIEGVMELEDAQVSEIMTPRTQVIGIPLNSTWKNSVKAALESGYSRLPVWKSSPDDIVGVLHLREILAELAQYQDASSKPKRTDPNLSDLLRPPYFIPETMSVQSLLRDLQHGKSHMAIVTDEFGGVCGIVTIEDALEEIVGEITDEHDETLADGILVESNDACETLANVPIDDLNQRMHFSLPEEADFDTVGGFAFHVFGRIPSEGETIASDGVSLEVLSSSRRRIDRLRITRLPQTPD
ncbi:MAG: HlyC/CorC family transporter [Pirellulales bacterium]|nr:HlyC/CorC family transporter [Pirellulales bacterium]